MSNLTSEHERMNLKKIAAEITTDMDKEECLVTARNFEALAKIIRGKISASCGNRQRFLSQLLKSSPRFFWN